MGIYYLPLILCDFSLSVALRTILSFSLRYFPTVSSLSPHSPPGWCFCASRAAPSLHPWLVSSALRLWPSLLTCTPSLSNLFHYPGVSHYLKIGNSWIFKLSFVSLVYAPDSYTSLLQVQHTQHKQKALSVLVRTGYAFLRNSMEFCSCVCKFFQGFNSHSPCHIESMTSLFSLLYYHSTFIVPQEPISALPLIETTTCLP